MFNVIHEPATEYFEKGGTYLSSHALADFRRCPLFYYKRHIQHVIPSTDSSTYLEGRAAHSLILEGREVYESEFVTTATAPISPTTGKVFKSNSKAYKEWAATQKGEIISDDIAYRVEEMNAAVKSHDWAMELLCKGEAEAVLRATYADEPCQIRIDWLNHTPAIVDLKTCFDLSEFENKAREYGYGNQLAFYRSVFKESTGVDAPVFIIAVEKQEPFRVGVWELEREWLDACEKENMEAIISLRGCRERGVWKSGYESLRALSFN